MAATKPPNGNDADTSDEEFDLARSEELSDGSVELSSDGSASGVDDADEESSSCYLPEHLSGSISSLKSDIPASTHFY